MKTFIDLLKYLKLNADGKKNIVNFEIRSLVSNSNETKENSIFFAIIGYSTDGHRYINDALERGASAIFVEKQKYDEVCETLENESDIQKLFPVENTRRYLALACKFFYDDITKKLTIIGITGTNGKTTTSYMIKNILEDAGKNVGLIGTINYFIKGECFAAPNTTPDVLVLYDLFNKMLRKGVEYVVMEVSSHSLYLDRVFGINFDVAIFTNLTQDHLDFHKTMDEYLNVKMKLFDILKSSKKAKKMAIINRDISKYKKICKYLDEKNLNYYSYGIDTNCDYVARDTKLKIDQTSFNVFSGNKELEINLSMSGLFNVYNSLCAIVCCDFLQIDSEYIKLALKRTIVKGRFQVISEKGFNVIVDYAHTDDALKNVLKSIRELNPKRIITVFGL